MSQWHNFYSSPPGEFPASRVWQPDFHKWFTMPLLFWPSGDLLKLLYAGRQIWKLGWGELAEYSCMQNLHPTPCVTLCHMRKSPCTSCWDMHSSIPVSFNHTTVDLTFPMAFVEIGGFFRQCTRKKKWVSFERREDRLGLFPLHPSFPPFTKYLFIHHFNYLIVNFFRG